MKTEYYQRGLPHFHHVGAIFAVTTQLIDAVPRALLEKLQNEYNQIISDIDADGLPEKALRKQGVHQAYELGMEKLLHQKNHQGHSLLHPGAAKIVADKIMQFDGDYYDCLAYTIMSNHIHLLLDFSIQLPSNYDGISEIPGYVNLDTAMKRIKGGTVQSINRLLNRKGGLWRRGYYNRYIRNQEHFIDAYCYILNNPVKAGLVEDWREHPFTYGKLTEVLV